MIRHLQVIVAGVLLAANAGCIALAAGAAAAGGAAAGYAYFSAPQYEDFHLAVPETVATTKAALADMQFPINKEEPTAEGVRIESEDGAKEKVVILVTSRQQKVLSDGPLTRVSVRVATFGDDKVSGQVLDHIHVRLPLTPVAAPSPTVVQTPPAVQPAVVRGDIPGPASGDIVQVQTVEPPQAVGPENGPKSVVTQPIR